MATATLVSIHEYLESSYAPDRDYVRGELQERNVGERPHSLLQQIIAAIFYNNRKTWNVVSGPEMRVQVAENSFRVPDICVLRRSDPVEDIVKTPPLICIEVLSPEDRIQRMQERIDDYARMGVENIWLIDPLSRHAWSVLPDGTQRSVSMAFTVPGTDISIQLTEVFAELDDMQMQG